MSNEQLTVNDECSNGKSGGLSRIPHRIFLLTLVLSLAIGLGIIIFNKMPGATTGATTSGDLASLAAYVSIAPEILDYSRYISGIA
jgi:hypothetical protein